MYCVVMLSRLFIAALWSPVGKVLTSWLSFVMFNCFFTFPCGIPGQVSYLIVSSPDHCHLSYLKLYIGDFFFNLLVLAAKVTIEQNYHTNRQYLKFEL